MTRAAWADQIATDVLRSLSVEPRPTNPPTRGAQDWALVVALVCWSVVKAVLRPDMAPRPLLLLAALAVVGPLPWRRAHPLVAVTVAFGTLTVVDIVRILTGSQGPLPASVLAALVLAYALFRWGSGREAAGGLGVTLVWLAITHVADPTSLAETVAGYAFFLFAAALSAEIRYRARIRIRDIDQAKSQSANSSPASSTTPSPTTSRASPSRPKQAGPSRPPIPSVPSSPGHHRGRGDPHPHRAARHRRRAACFTGHRVRAAAGLGRGRAVRWRSSDASLDRGDVLR